MKKVNFLKNCIVACAMLWSAMSFAAGTKIGNLYYVLDDDNLTASVTYSTSSTPSSSSSKNYSSLTAATIPTTVKYNSKTYTVTAIGDYAFYECTGLTSVNIPSSVTSIGSFAFGNCSGLMSLEIPASVPSIGSYVFRSCTSLVSLKINCDSTVIGYSAFHGCSALESVSILGGKVSMGSSVFAKLTKLANVEITSEITKMDGSVFLGCTGLTSLSLKSGVIGKNAFYGCTGLTSLEIPSGVTSIGAGAFQGCTGITSSVEIPSSVTSIGNSAFRNCGGSYYKINCDSTVIGDSAFYYCRASKLSILEGKASFGFVAFASMPNLAEAEITTEITNWGMKTSSLRGVFSECKALAKLTVKTGKIGSYAFVDCTGLTSVEILSGVTSINKAAFKGCRKLTAIEIPSNVTEIGESAFESCTGLTKVQYFGDELLIGNSVFNGCTSLSELHLKGVYKYGMDIFQDCSKLSSFYCYEKYPAATSTTVTDINTTARKWHYSFSSTIKSQTKLYVPKGCKNRYVTAWGWPDSNVIEMGEVESLVLNSSSATVNVGETMQLSAESGTEGSSLPEVVWFSSDKNVAKVDANGVVTGVSAGTAEITAYLTSNTEVAATCKVLVKAGEVAVVGDANGDGELTIADATAIVNYVMGKTVAGFDVAAADYNGDGTVSMADATAIINFIMNDF